MGQGQRRYIESYQFIRQRGQTAEEYRVYPCWTQRRERLRRQHQAGGGKSRYRGDSLCPSEGGGGMQSAEEEANLPGFSPSRAYKILVCVCSDYLHHNYWTHLYRSITDKAL